eukprot:EG_transcript_29701
MERLAQLEGCLLLALIAAGGEPGLLPVATAVHPRLEELQPHRHVSAGLRNVMVPSAAKQDRWGTLHKRRFLMPQNASDATRDAGPANPALQPPSQLTSAFSELSPKATRTAVVCRYTPTPTLCNASDSRLNPYHDARAKSTAHESVIDPAALLAAYRQEPGLRQLMDLLERTHLPEGPAGCRLR